MKLNKLLKLIFTLFAITGATVFFTGCEDAADEAGDAVEEAGDAVQDAGDAAQDAVHDGADAVKDATN